MLQEPVVRHPGPLLHEVNDRPSATEGGRHLNDDVRDGRFRVRVLLTRAQLPASLDIDVVLRTPAAARHGHVEFAEVVVAVQVNGLRSQVVQLRNLPQLTRHSP